MKIVLFFIFVMCNLCAFSQNILMSRGDSLLAKSMEEVGKNDVASALKYAKDAVLWNEDNYGKDSPKYDMAISNLAFLYFQNKEYDASIQLRLEQLQRYEASYGINSSEYAMILNLLSSCYFLKKENEKAIEYGEQAVAIYAQTQGKESNEYDISVNTLVMAYTQNSDWDKAITLKKEQLVRYEASYGKNNKNYDTALNDLIMLYLLKGDIQSIISLEIERLAICKEMYGEESLEYASVLEALSLYYSEVKDYERAIPSCRQAVSIYECLKGKESKEYSNALYILGNIMKLSGQYADAKDITEEALALKEKKLDPQDTSFVKQQYEIAKEYARNENYKEAVRIAKDIVGIVGAQSGKDGEAYAMALETLADYQLKLNEFTETIELLQKALEIRSVKQDANYAMVLNRLSDIEYALGNYEEAIKWNEKALSIWEQQDDEISIGYRKATLTSLAAIYSALGNRYKAGLLTKETLELDVKYSGVVYPEIVWRDVENDIQGDEDLSNTKEGQEWLIQMIQDGLAQMQTFGMTNTIDYAEALFSLGATYIKMADYAKAIEQLEQVEKIQKEIFGKENQDYILTLQILASCVWKQGDSSRALSLLQEALSLSEQLFPEGHPDRLSLLSSQTMLEARLGNSAAISHAVTVTTQLKELVLATFAYLTSVERTYYWNQYASWFGVYLPDIANRFKRDSLISTVYDGLLLSKGLLLNSEIEMRNLIIESNNEDLLDDYYRLRVIRSQIYALTEKEMQTIDSLEVIAEKIEKKLLRQCQAYGDYTKNLNISWRDIQGKLTAEDVAIEFLTVLTENNQKDYVALLLRKEDSYPVWVRLFSEDELNTIPVEAQYTSKQLSSLLWKPLEKYMQQKKNIYFSPTGQLYNIGIENLPSWDEVGLLSEKWNFYRLSSTRQLALFPSKKPLKTAAVYGGLVYNADVQTLVADSKKYARKRSSDIAFAQGHVRSLDLHGVVEELPATQKEALDIAEKLSSKQIADSLYMGVKGTETSFKSLSGRPINLVHIATHGFYWTEEKASVLDELGFLFKKETNALQYVEDKALTRTGLLFSGVNNVLSGKVLPENVDDGVLTAREISALDFRNLDMVVLSACQTGLGEITGDGVFGLQRGFKKSGAKSLLMSLWKVDDNATQMLMTHFYSNLMNGMNKYEALCKAQRAVREYEVEVPLMPDGLTATQKRRAEKQGTQKISYKHPKYWAAFILLDGIDR